MQPSPGRGPRDAPVTPPAQPVLCKYLRSSCLADQPGRFSLPAFSLSPWLPEFTRQPPAKAAGNVGFRFMLHLLLCLPSQGTPTPGFSHTCCPPHAIGTSILLHPLPGLPSPCTFPSPARGNAIVLYAPRTPPSPHWSPGCVSCWGIHTGTGLTDGPAQSRLL